MTVQLSPQFYLAACDEATRGWVNGYHNLIYARYYAYMMGNEL